MVNSSPNVASNSNITREVSHHLSSTPRIVSDEVRDFIELSLFHVATTSLGFLGVLTNSLCVAVYSKQGRKDSVTVSLLALSLSDLGLSLMTFLSVVSFMVERFAPLPKMNFIAFQYVVLAYTAGCFYGISTILTMYLSLERCICVAIPFHVKGMFTRNRSIVVTMFITIFCLSCYAPAWATQSLKGKHSPIYNTSRLTLSLTSNRRNIDIFVDSFIGIVLPSVAQVVITICTVVMISVLNASASFKKKMANKTGGGNKNDKDLKQKKSKPANLSDSQWQTAKDVMTEKSSEDVQQPTDKTLSSKEARVVKMVVLVALIFFVCNAPVLVTSYTRAFVTEMDIGKAYNNLYVTVYVGVYFSNSFNAWVNILVYYRCSSKFKETLLTMVRARHRL
ncbi:uncharacterized protein LOC101853556 [Aplysia californica]|uniref:Uncharacterized protein LOC101853556 n=1 Tax=Aplysia californica TaxID=6500 RepID=A0ABM1A0C3_APLCA|nr:uncharacterized protein LOC101853556 [Aplysia californica]